MKLLFALLAVSSALNLPSNRKLPTHLNDLISNLKKELKGQNADLIKQQLNMYDVNCQCPSVTPSPSPSSGDQSTQNANAQPQPPSNADFKVSF